jgi:predicted signal transduction protein with EAL and GGDEF domain
MSDLSDTFVQALPDLSFVVSRDGTILANIGGREFGVPASPGTLCGKRLTEVWSATTAAELARLARRALKLRGPVDGELRQPDCMADVRARPQGVGRALVVLRPPAAAVTSRPPEQPYDCVEFGRTLCAAIANAQLREMHVALAVIHVRDLRALAQLHGTEFAEQLVAAALERLTTTAVLGGSAGRAARTAQLEDDQLAVIIEQLSGRHAAQQAADELRRVVGRPYEIDGHRHRITPTIGVATFPYDGNEPELLLESARTAILEAQRSDHTHSIATASEASGLWSVSRADRLSELHWALGREQFALRFAPRVELGGRRTVALETELLWTHPVRGPVPPEEFMPLLKSFGLRNSIERWTLRRGTAGLARLNARGHVRVHLSVALGAASLEREDLIEEIAADFAAAGMSLARLDVSVDAKVLGSLGKIREHLRELRKRGASVFLEDFGTEDIALARLGNLPLDGVRLARSFTDRIDHDLSARLVCGAAAATAWAFGLRSVASGIARRAQMEFLFECGCDQASGPLFGAPWSAAESQPDATGAADAAVQAAFEPDVAAGT